MKLTTKKIAECAQWVADNGLGEYGGALIKEFCEAFDIDKTTYYRWLDNTTFATAIQKAKQAFKDNLEKSIVVSLVKAARGYTYEKTKTELGTNKEGQVVIKKQTKEKVEVAPNIGAAVFLLTNVAGDTWKNKQNTEVSANVKGEIETENNYNLEDVPDELLFALADKMQDATDKRIKEKKNGTKTNKSASGHNL